MIEENERAAKFIRAIQRDGEQRRTAIMKEIDDETAAEQLRVTKVAEMKANETEEYERARMQEDTNRKLSNAVLQTGAELAQKRSQITDEVFAACKEEILAFTNSENYGDFLKASMQNLLAMLHTDTATFLAAEKDVQQANAVVPEGCTVEVDDEILLGGLRAKVGSMQADDTLDGKLDLQKEWFLQHSGMSIALS